VVHLGEALTGAAQGLACFLEGRGCHWERGERARLFLQAFRSALGRLAATALTQFSDSAVESAGVVTREFGRQWLTTLGEDLEFSDTPLGGLERYARFQLWLSSEGIA
jgi:hypothetical protein